MSDEPLVSVIVIFLNAAKFIEEAIDSVLRQTYRNWEVLLIDDGSTDGSTEIVQGYVRQFPDKLRYLEHEGHQNRGMSATRNLGIRQARGEYIAFLDADDVWLPHKLERQVAVLESQPEAGMLYGPTQYWYSWTGLAADRERDNVPDLGVPLDTLVAPPKLLTILYPLGQASAPCLCSLLVRRDVLNKVGGFEEAFLDYYEDQAFLTKVYLSESVYVSSGCWDKYRIHSESCCATVERAGQYESYRRRFLEWLQHYLRSQAVTDPEVWKLLESALRSHQHPPAQQEHNWLLRVAEGNLARLVFARDELDAVRVEIAKTSSAKGYDTQLNLPGLTVKSNQRHVVKFMARADAPRSISIGFAKGHSPWTNLGLYRQIELTPQWQHFEAEFVVTDDEADARIHFDVGGNDASVELSSVTLLNSAEGKFVEQDSPSVPARPSVPSRMPAEPAVPVNEVEFGSLRRLTPISRDFGCDRGRPIDRYYIENFLAKHGADVRGQVLEIGESIYTRQFGGERVTVSDVLHVVEGEPQATIIADLASADHIPSDTFDCIILTQTLQLIYDVRAAIKTIYRILKPSGVLLATFPGISQTYDHEWADTWYWNFTAVSARRLFEEIFSESNAKIQAFGNVLAAISFLHGLAVDELTPEELDYREPGYDVTIAVRAVKPSNSDQDDRLANSLNQRQLARRAVGNAAVPTALILMYHRVAEGFSDPFSLCVTPQRFSEQLEVLREYATPMRLQDFIATLDNGGIAQPTAVITFDDGYADNLYHAKPLLERYDVPATVFITTGYIGGRHEFWWDELDRLLLQPGVLPQVLQLHVNGTPHEWDLGDAAHYCAERWREDCSWSVMEAPPTARHSVFFAVWRLLQFLPDLERRRSIEELRAWAGAPTDARPTHRQLSVREMLEVVDGGLIEAGAHTVTHPVLSRLSADLQRSEILQSKRRIEEILGRPVASFAYPFGSKLDYTDETAVIVREAGCACACSTLPGPVQSNPDRFQLPRIQVENWGADDFSRRLAEWLTP